MDFLRPLGLPVLAQELIPGMETFVESYHVYVDEAGVIAGECTGARSEPGRTRLKTHCTRDHGCDAKSCVAWNDLLPPVGAALWRCRSLLA
jgi:hypothetical protein